MVSKERDFDADQRMEIDAGIAAGVDVSCYAKKEFMAIQMRQIRLGLEESLDVSVYAKTEYDWFQMEEIRKGMREGVNYTLYAAPSISYDKMRQIREGLNAGIDLSGFVRLKAGVLRELRKAIAAKVSIVDYINEGYVEEQLEEIRLALEKGFDIEPYLCRELRGAAIREIRRGLEEGIDPVIYASIEYDWQQMREIRLGLEHRLDISRYSNSLYSWKQMREIRLGLEEGLDITPYRSFMYTATDMRRIRMQLSTGMLDKVLEKSRAEENIDERIVVFISEDEMEACVLVQCGQEVTFSTGEIMNAIKGNGVRQGILTEAVRQIAKEKKYNQTVVVARGAPGTQGQDGWYEYFFETELSRKPELLPDGSADYRNVKWYEQVEEGQKIAFYHAAEFGKTGYTVTGRLVASKKGKEKNVLAGKGFRILSDGKTYVSAITGKIELVSENRIEISKMCILDEVTLATGDVDFDGCVYVRGNVGSGVVIRAGEDVIVNGFVESAEIRCKGEILLRQGADGAGKGIIEAGKKVTGKFFEYIQVVSGGDIEANYCFNCNLSAREMIRLHGVKGTLAGGVAKAGKGIRAHNVGNHAKLPTVLKMGMDETVFQKKYATELKLKETSRELVILGNAYLDFQRKYLPEVRNTMDMYLKIENAIYTKELEMDKLDKMRKRLEQDIENMTGATAVIEGCLYEGTIIYIDNIKFVAYSVRNVIVRRSRDTIVVQSH